MSARRRAAIAIPLPYDTDCAPIFDINDDVSLLSPIHQQVFRPSSLQQLPSSSRVFQRTESIKKETISSQIPMHNLLDNRGDLDKVVDETHFSKNEVRSIYRAFKETSPNAVINKEILREKFGELFPHGDIEHFSDLLFETFDNDGNGTINFQEFVRALSVLCRGTLDEKLDWLYKLYDPKEKGEVTWHRLFYVITATDDLIGRKAKPTYSREQRASRAHIIYAKFDINKTGHITKENFIHVCKTDPQIMESISALYTILPG
ncbi:ncs-4 [Pristionchus pacificus]|uniref:Ncs-4 n=1 Tax=Pristionchus pacificus TaxID=54126 RepID=A0A2A6CUM9_PRIPA|nr:ncs-4 [Pristionchus pacificus]|eukprot:PDM81828.1 ncs-4 [Pristionchus pacificus]